MHGIGEEVWEEPLPMGAPRSHYVLLKSNEEYYQDPVCKNGYFRGTETYNFVRDVIGRAEMYQAKIKR